MSLRFCQHPWLTDVIDTTNAVATASTATQFAPPSGSAGMIEVRGVARLTSGASSGHSAPFYLAQGFSDIGGVVTMEGSVTTLVAISSGNAALSTVTVTIGITASKVTVTVTGIAATNIEWLLDVRFTGN